MPMEQLIELLKQAGAILGVAVPAIALWLSSRNGRPKELEERALRLQTFFHEGGVEQPPILMEARFGAAMGHLNLSAKEIPMVLRQHAPTQFLQRYLHVKRYIEPAADGSTFILKSFAAKSIYSYPARVVLFIFYAFYAGAAMWLLLEELPKELSGASWLNALGTGVFICFFAGGAWYFLVEARRITWAIQLHKGQNAT